MYKKTEAIVLKTTKYNDNSLILKLFTKSDGLQSYIVSISKKGNKMALFQGLNQITIETTQHGNHKLGRIKNAQLQVAYRTIYNNWLKGTVIQFLNEILYNSIQEETANVDLYEFLELHLCYFDEIPELEPNFHLYFLIKMSKYLGFYPQGKWQNGMGFHLQNGSYQTYLPNQEHLLKSEVAEVIYLLSTTPIHLLNQIKIGNQFRKDILKIIVQYYRLHLDGFKDLKSHDVLEAIFS
jgi:DNA repair protein RecO (recombination protein O)